MGHMIEVGSSSLYDCEWTQTVDTASDLLSSSFGEAGDEGIAFCQVLRTPSRVVAW
jgi:hypothetical protein